MGLLNWLTKEIGKEEEYTSTTVNSEPSIEDRLKVAEATIASLCKLLQFKNPSKQVFYNCYLGQSITYNYSDDCDSITIDNKKITIKKTDAKEEIIATPIKKSKR